MKPRLKSTPETNEDWDVWLWVNALWLRNGNPVVGPRWPYTESDRRDADLMLRARLCSVARWGWLVHTEPGVEFTPWGGPLLCSYEIKPGTRYDITYFA